ncbi:apoptosis-antagonizing transcription factor [Syncephalis plumigaleata]|nr:apoptosis-antagonizing transcription factor [Syncephalis plumigaleata]
MPTSRRKQKKSLGEQLASLLDPTPQDVDPEEFGETFQNHSMMDNDNSDANGGDNSDDDDDDGYGQVAARAHYIDMGRSQMRNNTEFLVDDPKYEGKAQSRSKLYESDDEEHNNRATVDRSYSSSLGSEEFITADEQEDSEDNVSEEEEEEEEDEEDEHQNDMSSEEEQETDMNMEDVDSTLKEMEKEERQLKTTITQGAKSDVSKGIDVRHQMLLWDNLLDTRIRLQKSVLLANQLPQSENFYSFVQDINDDSVLRKTHQKIYGLLEDLVDLRLCIIEQNATMDVSLDSLKQRKRSHEVMEKDGETIDWSLGIKNLDNIWSSVKQLENSFKPYMNETLEKWHNKVQVAAGVPLNKKFKAINQGVHEQINQVLADKDRLVKRTQLKRNDYQILGRTETTTVNEHDTMDDTNKTNGEDSLNKDYDNEIFDDTDFYQQLLRELIESRMVDTDDPMAIGVRWAALKQQTKKNKKKVDTKASKGRKLRYHVHDKLQNFMVPIPTGTWHQEMTDELYASLFGQQQQQQQRAEREQPTALVEQTITNDFGGLRLFS